MMSPKDPKEMELEYLVYLINKNKNNYKPWRTPFDDPYWKI